MIFGQGWWGGGRVGYREGCVFNDVELTTNKCQGFLYSGGHVLTASTQCRGADIINVSGKGDAADM